MFQPQILTPNDVRIFQGVVQICNLAFRAAQPSVARYDLNEIYFGTNHVGGELTDEIKEALQAAMTSPLGLAVVPINFFGKKPILHAGAYSIIGSIDWAYSLNHLKTVLIEPRKPALINIAGNEEHVVRWAAIEEVCDSKWVSRTAAFFYQDLLRYGSSEEDFRRIFGFLFTEKVYKKIAEFFPLGLQLYIQVSEDELLTISQIEKKNSEKKFMKNMKNEKIPEDKLPKCVLFDRLVEKLSNAIRKLKELYSNTLEIRIMEEDEMHRLFYGG